MARAGRPKLLQKEGHHRHDGYSRWHPIDQVHRPDLHDHVHIVKSDDIEPSFVPESSESTSPALEIYNLVSALEKMEYGKALLFELQNTIQTIMRVKQLQRDKKVDKEYRNEQSAIGGEDAEDREPNTYGLP